MDCNVMGHFGIFLAKDQAMCSLTDTTMQTALNVPA